MDHDYEKQIADNVNKALMPLDEHNPLPGALSREAVAALLKEKSLSGEVAGMQKAKRKINRRRLTRRVVSAAAAFAVLVGSGAVLSRVYDNSKTYVDESWPQTPVPMQAAEEEQLPEHLKKPASYAELEKKFLSIRNAQSSFFDYNGGLFGQKSVMEDAMTAPAAADTDRQETANGADTETTSSGNKHGETNVQVQGVDEADIIKNDGTYLYVAYTEDIPVTTQDSGEYKTNDKAVSPGYSPEYGTYYGMKSYPRIKIVKAYPADSMETAATIKLDEAKITDSLKDYTSSGRYVNEFYLKDNRLYVLVTESYYKGSGDSYENKTLTTVIVYDVANKTAPQFVKAFSQDGSYLSSRITSGRLIVMTNHGVQLYGSREALANSCVPGVYEGGESKKIAVDSILMIEGAESSSYLVLSNINLANLDETPAYKSVLGGGKDSYCTSDTLYISNVVYDNSAQPFTRGVFEIAADIAFVSAKSYTEVFCFDVAGGIDFRGSGKVPGHPLNQFAMDEYNGYFRIATTDTGSDGKTVNNVFVMNREFEIVGSVEGLAKGESIQSVRFMGDTGYVVTFFRTDPLFVIDLKDPTAPKVLGELKIPGFSQYLHPVGDGLLVGVGVSGDENGQTDGVKVSLFDVKNPAEPKEIAKLEIARAYVSDISHKAFLTVADENLYGFPIAMYGYTANYQYFDQNGLYTFKVENGTLAAHKFFTPQGQSQNAKAFGSLCRGTYINDVVYFVNGLGITAFSMQTGEQIATH
ncbi:MAG: beta-propeller domain-containing protein [Oscillospiraceae bacterium]|nr:beta-propeller domain-containing protein [Oscillospiraceae bacterium]